MKMLFVLGVTSAAVGALLPGEFATEQKSALADQTAAIRPAVDTCPTCPGLGLPYVVSYVQPHVREWPRW